MSPLHRRHAPGWIALLCCLTVGGGVAVSAAAPLRDPPRPPARTPEPIQELHPVAPAPPAPQAANGPTIAWRHSESLGKPYARGRLRNGVQLPAEGPDWFTWDPVRKQVPNRPGRRWGTDRLLRFLLDVLREYRAADPSAPRVGIGDLSRPRGGEFGKRFGGLGHASHQNGLDVDVYYPRLDGQERRPYGPDQVDQDRAQDLVDRFVDAGAQKLFVGPRLDLRGPKKVVSKLIYHDDHVHVRIRPR
jgi:murein endopeptidase